METDLKLRVRLVRKLADSLDGVDVSQIALGQSLDLAPASARTLILEGWAELVDPIPVEAPSEPPAEIPEPPRRPLSPLKEEEPEPEPY